MITKEQYNKIREDRGKIATQQQRFAANPKLSVWVEASAGTGKTKVLSDRVLSLLLNGVSSKEICIEVGFSSQAYFVTVFKRFYNMTPSEYIKITRNNA